MDELPWICTRCGRVLVGEADCSAHAPPVAFHVKGIAFMDADELRAGRPENCSECGHTIEAEALPGVEAVCSACKSPMTFMPEGWCHSARI